ncbi:MAG TPA: GNAT family N-acetyltransferase [Longimicrobium sp.]|nr:GNAT family N-acetyltransferase [Longimicrobium sp.]
MPSPASAASSASAERTTSAPAVSIREIGRGESLKPFINLSWTINGGDPNWVPPLRMVFNALMNRDKHPFYQHADVAFFVAERAGKLVGRVAAIANHRANEFHGDTTGFFGLFECIDDEGVARALLDRAAAWLKAKGLASIQGPFNLSTNDELYSGGVLIDGFDTPPAFMLGHNPPYYQRLVEAAGFGKAKDLLAYWLPHNDPPKRLIDGIDRVAKREGWRIRSVDLKRFEEEVATVMGVYNSAWERNWGFIPMTDAEFDSMAREFKPVVDPHLVLIAEKDDGEAIGFLLALPDLNRAIKPIRSGRLFPFGVFKFLWHKRKIRTARVLTLGMKPGYQRAGIGAALYLKVFQMGAQYGYDNADCSWILEDNGPMRQALEKVGAYVYKTYRVYERPL